MVGVLGTLEGVERAFIPSKMDFSHSDMLSPEMRGWRRWRRVQRRWRLEGWKTTWSSEMSHHRGSTVDKISGKNLKMRDTARSEGDDGN